ncbi:acyl-CoA dehydrogenase family protein, partial [Actinomadura adrarensis]
MSSQILSRRDLEFLLHEWLDVERLTARPRYADHDRTTFDAVLELAERIATDHFAPHNKLSDANEPTFDGERVQLIPEIKKALDVFAESGLPAANLDAEYGGMQLPHVVGSACTAWFQAAAIATQSYALLT